MSRHITTEGIVISLNENVISQIVSDWTQRRPNTEGRILSTILYHSASHAFLKCLPMVSGLDTSEFSESILSPQNQIAVYDNSPGGIGGVRTVCEGSSGGLHLSGDYAAQVLNSLDCQLDCSWSCKACLHTSTCGWLNRQLQREMLRSIIDERARNIYFSS